MQERLHGVGGALEITATPRGGAQLLISIPVEADGGDPDSPR
jgi:signal transduction histidine kinase